MILFTHPSRPALAVFIDHLQLPPVHALIVDNAVTAFESVQLRTRQDHQRVIHRSGRALHLQRKPVPRRQPVRRPEARLMPAFHPDGPVVRGEKRRSRAMKERLHLHPRAGRGTVLRRPELAHRGEPADRGIRCHRLGQRRARLDQQDRALARRQLRRPRAALREERRERFAGEHFQMQQFARRLRR
ncbi:hypothetical protein LMG29542_08678 [Paraburkholderia humisilvae]|uniref:Uncharacterized protein n=1 Tax=Paraburkholderia humisilvae TaxID=627669 RepID=A0A6J5FDE9_9BURK|nr:hypothetical protein LMG29542_08678 [Paraburkholderia humisilvae]